MCTRNWHRSPAIELAETLRRLRDGSGRTARTDPAPAASCGAETLPLVNLAVMCGAEPSFVASATTAIWRVAPRA